MSFDSGSAVLLANMGDAFSNSVGSGDFTVTSGRVLLVATFSGDNAGDLVTPSLSGAGTLSGATFTSEGTGDNDVFGIRLTIFRCLPSSSGTGSITATWPSDQVRVFIAVVEVDDANTGGTNGDDATVQISAVAFANSTAVANTLNAFADANNGVILFFVVGDTNTSATPEAGYTELLDSGTANDSNYGMGITWKESSDTSPTATLAVAQPWVAFSLELAAGAVGVTGTLAATMQEPTATLSGGQTYDGTIAATMQAALSTISGFQINNSIIASLQKLAYTGTATQTFAAVLTAVMQELGANMSGGQSGSIVSEMQAMTFTGSSRASQVRSSSALNIKKSTPRIAMPNRRL